MVLTQGLSSDCGLLRNKLTVVVKQCWSCAGLIPIPSNPILIYRCVNANVSLV